MPPKTVNKQHLSPCRVLVGRILYGASLLSHQKSPHHLKKSDLQTLAQLNAQPECPKSSARRGGGVHLPSEYFGQPSGQYYDVPGFPSDHTVYTSSSTLARNPLMATTGGSHGEAVTEQMIKECVAYHDKDIKVEPAALEIIRLVVASTLSPSTSEAQAKTMPIQWSKVKTSKTTAKTMAPAKPAATKKTK